MEEIQDIYGRQRPSSRWPSRISHPPGKTERFMTAARVERTRGSRKTGKTGGGGWSWLLCRSRLHNAFRQDNVAPAQAQENWASRGDRKLTLKLSGRWKPPSPPQMRWGNNKLRSIRKSEPRPILIPMPELLTFHAPPPGCGNAKPGHVLEGGSWKMGWLRWQGTRIRILSSAPEVQGKHLTLNR